MLLRGSVHWNKGIFLQSRFNGVDDGKGILSEGRDIAPDATESFCSLKYCERYLKIFC